MDFILSSDATIRTALATLEMLQDKICVVVADDGTIRRTVTDGDVRRFLLAGGSLDDTVTRLPERTPVIGKVGVPDHELYASIKQHAVQAIVIVSELGVPLRVRSLSSFESKLLLSPPHMGLNEFGYVQQAFDDNWIAPAGPNLNRFEHDFAEKTGRVSALAVSSGTAALHLALRVLNVGAGDRIYVSDLTFAASVQPILYQNAVPVLIDSEPCTWNMSPLALERKLREDKIAGQLPSAIIVVHLYGQSADIESIMRVADEYGVPVVEDATESLGAVARGKPSGAHGLLSAYSFNGNKMITTSGGGALVSDRVDLIERARKLSTQGRDPADHYQHSEIAYNYRMSNILAGIGIGQLEVLDARVARRREIFDLYRQGLSDLPGISFQGDAQDTIGCRWLTVIECDPDRVGCHPYQIMRRLAQSGIETRPAWKPMNMQPLCKDFEFVPHTEDQVVSSTLFLRSLCLPSGTRMTDSDVARVVGEIRSIIEENS